MPEFGSMTDSAGGASVQSGESTPYQAGVRAYLNGRDEEAISSLKEAVRQDAADERSSRLLLKVYIRAINGAYESGNRQKARSLVKEAHARFPSNPEIKLMYSSSQESRTSDPPATAAARPEPPPVRKKTQAAAGATGKTHRAEYRSPEDAAAPLQRAAQPAPAAPPQEKASPGTDPEADRITIPHLKAITAAGPLLLAVIALIYFQHRQQKTLLQQIEAMQKALTEGKGKSDALHKELEVWKGFGKQVEELELLRKTKEQAMHLELEKFRMEEERKIRAELAEKRRDAERLARLEMENQLARNAVKPAPQPGKPPQPPAPPKPPPPGVAKNSSASRESQILEILSDIAPPEREAAWERISVQSAALYADSPEEAIKFFRTIAGDKNPLNRASIAGALAGIGAPETLDILLSLYQDPSVEVRREALKQFDILHKNADARIDAAHMERIAACLSEEKEKGDWVF